MTDGEFRRRYKLPSSRAAKGPPSKVIPQKQFEEITKTVQKKRAQTRKRERDDFWF
jgi:hypothetical protein